MLASQMKLVTPTLAFVARHFLFVVLAMITGGVLWTIAYLVLLVLAVLSGQGLGGSLAYPAGILTAIATGVFLGWGVFAPSAAMGSIFCGLFGFPRIAAIPVVFAAAFFLSYLLYWGYIELGTTHSMPSAWAVLKNFSIFLSIPLGIYWWLTEGPGALFDAFRRMLRISRAKVLGESS